MIQKQIALLFLLAAANFVGAWPRTLGFDQFAFGDTGWALTVDAMLDDGLKPVADFGYFYGLLTLVIDRAVFAVAGRTPWAVGGLYAVCALLVTVGIARTMLAAKVDRVSAVFLAVCAAYMVMPVFYPSPAHAVEAALLANALAFHAGGRPGRALVLVTLAVFVKPSLGYFYGLILLLLILGGWPDGTRRWRRLVPATAVGLTVLGTLIATFGWDAVVRTQLPFNAGKAYQESGFGFLFGSGRKLWLPDQPSVRYYLLYPPGVWLATSVFLVVAAVRLLPHARTPASNLVATCAVLHLVFVFVLFGNQWSWIYYPYILFVGAAVGMTEWNRLAEAAAPAPADPDAEPPPKPMIPVAMGLLTLAALGQVFSVWLAHPQGWASHSRSEVTAGLYARPAVANDWKGVRELAGREKVFVLSRMGAAHVITPGLDGPRAWCLTRTASTPAELERVREQIRAADRVVSANWHDNDLMEWPEFAPEFRAFALDTSFTRHQDAEQQDALRRGQIPPPKMFDVYKRVK